MKENFSKLLPLLWAHEGGYVDHPKDPGGATNFGITFNTLQAYRGRKITKADVRALTKIEAAAIYKQEYWDRIWGDKLPSGLDYAVFDDTVNSGAKRAITRLQRVLGMTGKDVDGLMGSETLDRVMKDHRPIAVLITDYCDARLSWLKTLSTFKTFGKGWTSRVQNVATQARAMANKAPVPSTVPPVGSTEKPAKADQTDVKVTEALKSPEAWGPITGLLSAAGALFSGAGPVQYVLAVGIAVGIGIGVWYVIKKLRAE